MTEPKFLPRKHPKDPRDIWTHSIVSHRTGRGFVVVEWNNEVGQFDPEDARHFAHTLMREADNAETDAWVYSLLKDKLKLDDHMMAAIITDFRTDRARLEQLAGLRTTKDDLPEEDRR
ncbi:MAG TPA: hypothetical protein VK789_28155 [Bryobacteraceae bacterium]|nr:hypothetical protein [Bryobacteraceae bacterium]